MNAASKPLSEDLSESLDLCERIESQNWSEAAQDLDAYGNAVLPKILPVEECQRLARGAERSSQLRSRRGK